jgi:excisionase family DNA binding protein
MSGQPLEQQTYLPGSSEGVAEVLSFIQAHEAARGSRLAPRYFLAGSDEGDQVEIPEMVYRILLQVLEAMKAGKAVTVAPQNMFLTTQQAADLLGVSRPTVVKLVESGEVPAQTPGQRRRMIKLDDVLAYRARRREAQYRALLETSVDDFDLGEDPQKVAEDLARIRAEVAARRRARATV